MRSARLRDRAKPAASSQSERMRSARLRDRAKPASSQSERLRERHDSDQDLRASVSKLAGLISAAKGRVVAYTGAVGLSRSLIKWILSRITHISYNQTREYRPLAGSPITEGRKASGLSTPAPLHPPPLPLHFRDTPLVLRTEPLRS